MRELFETIRESIPPALWSKAVKLARTCEFLEDAKDSPDERILRMTEPGKPFALMVTLWPEECDWFCDCKGKDDPCLHVAACAIHLNSLADSGKIPKKTEEQSAIVNYEFFKKENFLHLKRVVKQGKKKQEVTKPLPIFQNLCRFKLNISKLDLTIDQLIQEYHDSIIPTKIMTRLIPLLADLEVRYNNQKIKAESAPIGFVVHVEDEPPGVRIFGQQDPSIVEIFKNGVALCKNKSIRPINHAKLTPQELKMLAEGRYFGAKDIVELVSDILPSLAKRLAVSVHSARIPLSQEMAPRLELKTSEQEGLLYLAPFIVYGDPVIGRIVNKSLETYTEAIPIRDFISEKKLETKLLNELGFELDKQYSFKSDAAVALLDNIKTWTHSFSGNGWKAFTLYEDLKPSISTTQENGSFKLSVQFTSPSPTDNILREADPQAVISSWERGESLVPLLSGGWAKIPKSFLDEHGYQIRALLASLHSEKCVASYMLYDLHHLQKKLKLPDPGLADFLNLTHQEQQEICVLPKDITIKLRGYQESGVNWLLHLKNLQVGALLADDMGLGKTAQTICILGKRSLVIAPTSVLYNWENEIKKVRPSLSICLYHGIKRSLDLNCDVILTSYALLRMDLEKLKDIYWDTIVLDEAQNIKNATSQAALSSYQLQGRFRVALSGTPIENRLEDLWAQMRFLNPFLLGELKQFQERYVKTTRKEGPQELAERVRPFILRRRKNEVAKELPERLENVLYCELSEDETSLYQSLFLATKKEILEQLQIKNNWMQALEALLRLRQAVCFAGLIPGIERESSTKIDLLIRSLSECLAEGHKVLVFSQWTKFLDKIEQEIEKNEMKTLRIDGSTVDRARIVDLFQNDPEQKILLLSLKAAGVGLNLTAADHVFIMDPWWNPAAEQQAADRAHRIGQTKPVFVYRMVARNTIEEKIVALQNIKKQFADAVLNAETSSSQLNKEDLLSLFDDQTF